MMMKITINIFRFNNKEIYRVLERFLKPNRNKFTMRRTKKMCAV